MSILRLHVLRTFVLSARLFVSGIGLLALVGPSRQLSAQAPERPSAGTKQVAAANVRFEVASIKRNREGEAQRAAVPIYVPVIPGRAQTLPGGRLRGPNMSVRELIRDAYGYRNRPHSEIVGAPDWIDKERYDVEARADYEFPGSTGMGLPPAAETALRALLAERFKLQVRMELRRGPVYELVIHRADRRLGPNLVPSKLECRPFFQREPVNTALIIVGPAEGQPKPLPPCLLGVGAGGISATNMTMTDFVRLLGLRPQINRTVIDRTGLMEGFDITLTYPLDTGALNPLPAIKPLLESQLGLTLRDAVADVEILVVENVEHPTEN